MNAKIFLTLCKKNKIERLTNENIFWFFPCFFVFLLTSINNFDFVIRYPHKSWKKILWTTILTFKSNIPIKTGKEKIWTN